MASGEYIQFCLTLFVWCIKATLYNSVFVCCLQWDTLFLSIYNYILSLSHFLFTRFSIAFKEYLVLSEIIVREYRRGKQKGQSRETGNIDEEKQNKNTTQYVLDTTIRKQTQIK